MSAWLRQLWIINWSIRSKLIFGFLLAVCIPVLLLGFVMQQEVRALDLRNLQAYLSDKGVERQQAVRNAFAAAGQTLSIFANDATYEAALRRLMTGDSLTQAERDSLNTYLNTHVTSGQFNDIRILSPEGRVLLTTDAEAARVGVNQSGTTTYRTATTASLLRATQRLSISFQRGELVLEVIHVVYRQAGPDDDIGQITYGYIIGNMNYEQTLIDNLRGEGAFITTNSYLVTANRSLIASGDSPFSSADDAPITNILNNRRRAGVEIYDAEDQSFAGYYAPVNTAFFRTPFFVITETTLDANLTLANISVYQRVGVVFVFLVIFGVLMAFAIGFLFVPALRSLQDDIQAIGQDDFIRTVQTAGRGDEIGTLARTFVNIREQMMNSLDGLEARLNLRNRDIQATQEVSRFAATQRDMQRLMDHVVDLVVDLFPNIYHAQIFLIDRENRYAILRASTGESGKLLLERGHRLGVGSISVIGQVTAEGRVVLARDTEGSDIHRQNEFLPETRAELAIPLRIGDNVIGALDVQSTQSNSFTDDQISILQTMSGQIAIAIENARLYQESIRRLAEVAEDNREATRIAWREHLNYQRQPILVKKSGAPGNQELSLLRQLAISRNEAVIGERTPHDTVAFAVPIQLRDQALGAVEWEIPMMDFNREKVRLAQELVNRLAVSLENARLFQANKRAIEREKLVNEIATKLTQQTDIDEILQTAVREVGLALQAPHASIQLKLKATADRPEEPTMRIDHE